jgi:hypothetical protein
MGSHYVRQAGFELLGSRDLPASASGVVGSTGTTNSRAHFYLNCPRVFLVFMLLQASFHILIISSYFQLLTMGHKQLANYQNFGVSRD